jgi:hypothetical protein
VAGLKTPGERAHRRIGFWPVRVGKVNGLARRHAASVWETARLGAVSRAGGLWAETGGDLRGFLGQVDLAFLATVAGHMRRCEACWEPWMDQEVPGELLTRAVMRIEAWAVLRAVVGEIRERGRQERRAERLG